MTQRGKPRHTRPRCSAQRRTASCELAHLNHNGSAYAKAKSCGNCKNSCRGTVYILHSVWRGIRDVSNHV